MKNFFPVLCVLAAGVVAFGTATSAEARSVIRVDETVGLSDDQSVVGGDFYGAGSTVVVSGSVDGDAVIAGANVTINGKVASDTLAFGLTTDVHGEVGDDVRIVGGDVTVASHVHGDLVVFARRLKLLSTAQVDGDVIFFGQEADLSGKIGRDVMGTMTTLRIDAPVGGDVEVTVSELTVGDKAAITGDVQYASLKEITRAPNAVISGSLVRNEAPAATPKSALQSVLEIILPLLFAVLCWYLFVHTSLEQLVRSATTAHVRSLVVGLVAFALFPVGAGILILSGLGSILGIILLVSYFGLLGIATIGMVAVGGGFLRLLIQPKRAFGLVWLVAGALLVALALLFPYVGVVVLILLFLVTLGALIERIYHSLR